MSCFKEEKFSKTPDQRIDLTVCNFHICVNNHSLTNKKCSPLVFNCLKGGVFEL